MNTLDPAKYHIVYGKTGEFKGETLACSVYFKDLTMTCGLDVTVLQMRRYFTDLLWPTGRLEM